MQLGRVSCTGCVRFYPASVKVMSFLQEAVKEKEEKRRQEREEYMKEREREKERGRERDRERERDRGRRKSRLVGAFHFSLCIFLT